MQHNKFTGTRDTHMPTVRSDNLEVTELFSKAFSDVALEMGRNPGCRISFNRAREYLSLFRDLDVTEPQQVQVEQAPTGRVGFRYDGFVPPVITADYPVPLPPWGFYHETNESYSEETVRMLKSVSGITHYLGILGGIDGPLVQIGVLGQSNPLSSVSCIDANSSQTFFGMLRLFEYNLSPTNAIKDTLTYRGLGADVYARSGKTIDLLLTDITEGIRAVNENGTYFIYLSNVFDLHFSFKGINNGKLGFELDNMGFYPDHKTREALDAIMLNPFISDGSYVMIAKPTTTVAILLRKNSGLFSLGPIANDSGKGLFIDRTRQQDIVSALMDPEMSY